MFTLRKVQRNGNAVAINLPSKMVYNLGWKRGDTVLLTVAADCLVVRVCNEVELAGMMRAGLDAALAVSRGEE